MTVEMKNGDLYRGYLEEAQDNMNLTLKNCKKTDRNGKETMVEITYIRGGNIVFIVIPSMLSKAPFFDRIKLWRQFKGHAQRGANTVEVAAGRGGRGGGRGGFGGGRGGFGGGGRGFGGGGGGPRGPGQGPPGGMGMGMGMGMPPVGRGAAAVRPAWQDGGGASMGMPPRPMGQNPYGPG